MLRSFVWYIDFILYNEKAQDKGMSTVQRNIGLLASLTLLPAKLYRLTIGMFFVVLASVDDIFSWV